MIWCCQKCGRNYDDETCWSICPHGPLWAAHDAYCPEHDLVDCPHHTMMDHPFVAGDGEYAAQCGFYVFEHGADRCCGRSRDRHHQILARDAYLAMLAAERKAKEADET